MNGCFLFYDPGALPKEIIKITRSGETPHQPRSWAPHPQGTPLSRGWGVGGTSSQNASLWLQATWLPWLLGLWRRSRWCSPCAPMHSPLSTVLFGLDTCRKGIVIRDLRGPGHSAPCPLPRQGCISGCEVRMRSPVPTSPSAWGQAFRIKAPCENHHLTGATSNWKYILGPPDPASGQEMGWGCLWTTLTYPQSPVGSG